MIIPIGFKGRATRTQWWLVHIVGIISMIAALPISPWLAIGMALVATILFTFVTVQRFHDLNLSGWRVLLPGVPIIQLGFLSGTPGDNRFGPPPGGGNAARSGGPFGQDAGTASIDMSKIDAAIERMKAQAMANAQQAKAAPMPAAAMPAAPMPTAPMPGRPGGAMGRPAFGQRTTFGQRG